MRFRLDERLAAIAFSDCVNAVATEFTERDMTADLDAANRTQALEQIPPGRMGLPGDVAGTVAFPVSLDADYLWGQVIQVKGGLYR